jgi:hypothetical protein
MYNISGDWGLYMTPFGTLTKKANKIDIKHILNQNTMEIEYLFKGAENQLEKMTVISAERQIALDSLRKLTQELQDKRLDYNKKDKLGFFTV